MPKRKNVEPMTTGPHTFPTMDSCRILSCIITPCNVDNPNCITCDTSRHIHHLSCGDAEQDYLPHHYPSQGFEPAFARSQERRINSPSGHRPESRASQRS